MIDFLLGLALGVTAVLLFKGQNPAKQAGELSSMLALFTNFKTELKTMITDALTDLKTAADADKAKAVAEAAAPAKAEQAAADEQAVRDFTAANYPPADPNAAAEPQA